MVRGLQALEAFFQACSLSGLKRVPGLIGTVLVLRGHVFYSPKKKYLSAGQISGYLI